MSGVVSGTDGVASRHCPECGLAVDVLRLSGDAPWRARQRRRLAVMTWATAFALLIACLATVKRTMTVKAETTIPVFVGDDVTQQAMDELFRDHAEGDQLTRSILERTSFVREAWELPELIVEWAPRDGGAVRVRSYGWPTPWLAIYKAPSASMWNTRSPPRTPAGSSLGRVRTSGTGCRCTALRKQSAQRRSRRS